MSDSKFCHNCGAQLVPGAIYCQRCGTPVPGAAPPAGSAVPSPATPGPAYPNYPYRRRHEKQEKNEKNEKGEKGEKGGKGFGIIGPVVGGLILVWLGVTFFLAQNGTLVWSNWWAYFIAGIGAILILQGILMFGLSRRTFYGPFIGGAILLLIGLSYLANIYSWANFWPLILVIIGVVVLISAFVGRRRSPTP